MRCEKALSCGEHEFHPITFGLATSNLHALHSMRWIFFLDSSWGDSRGLSPNILKTLGDRYAQNSVEIFFW